VSGYVYFITMEPDQYVKIGWALRNPWSRMRELQTGCPEALRMMAAAPGTRDEERRLHETFAELHYRGEWFIMDHKLYDLVQYLSDGWPRETNEIASRQTFENGIWDVVIAGFDFPHRPNLDEYRKSGDGRLWRHMHPEMVDA
jgi:hypothetical protein